MARLRMHIKWWQFPGFNPQPPQHPCKHTRWLKPLQQPVFLNAFVSVFMRCAIASTLCRWVPQARRLPQQRAPRGHSLTGHQQARQQRADRLLLDHRHLSPAALQLNACRDQVAVTGGHASSRTELSRTLWAPCARAHTYAVRALGVLRAASTLHL